MELFSENKSGRDGVIVSSYLRWLSTQGIVVSSSDVYERGRLLSVLEKSEKNSTEFRRAKLGLIELEEKFEKK